MNEQLLIPPRNNRLIACEELNPLWDGKEVLEFKRLWKEGHTIHQIASYLGRKPKEVAILMIDQFTDIQLRKAFASNAWGELPREVRTK